MQAVISDIYLPKAAVIREIIEENSQIKTFVLEFADEKAQGTFTYEPGQFMMVSVPHCGEAPISFSSTPTRPGEIHLSVRCAGRLTGALHEMQCGDVVGLRGPYGRPFPMGELVGRDLLFVAGGIGLAPLRSVINFCRDYPKSYGGITVLYGSRLPSDIAFKEDLDAWHKSPSMRCLLTVDRAEPGWQGPVGLVTALLDGLTCDPVRTTALVCGPPLMIRSAIRALSDLGFDDRAILTTLERHMKCGIGHCRHCYMDDKLVCADGPVFSLAELRNLDVMELRG